MNSKEIKIVKRKVT